MLQQFTIDLRLHKNGFLCTLLGLVCAFLFGAVLVAIIMHTDDDPGGWFCMGTLIAALALLMLILFTSAFGYPQEFMLALSMGRTRKAFLGAFYLRLLLQLVLGWITVLLLHQIELAAYPLLYPAYGNDAYFSFLTDPRLLIPLFLLLPVFSMFLGALYGKHGRKGVFAFYVIWLLCCFILPRMFHDEPSNGVLDRVAFGLMRVIRVVPAPVWIGFGIVTLAVMVGITVKFGMEQMVK